MCRVIVEGDRVRREPVDPTAELPAGTLVCSDVAPDRVGCVTDSPEGYVLFGPGVPVSELGIGVPFDASTLQPYQPD